MNKLSQIQKSLKAPKNQFNSFGKYNYRNCEDILEALKPLLDECTLTISDEIVMIGNRFYVKATATLKDVSEGEFSVSAYAREDETKKGMDLAQVTGSASSYARKYALNGLFLIDDTKDSDATNKHDKDDKEKTKQTEQPKDDVPEQEQPQDNIVVTVIKDIQVKAGTTNGKPWKLFTLVTESGDTYGTFSETVADMASTFIKEGSKAKITFEKTAKGNKQIVELAA